MYSYAYVNTGGLVQFGNVGSATPFWWRDVSAMVVANVLYEKSVFLKYKIVALKRHFKGPEKKCRYRRTDLTVKLQ